MRQIVFAAALTAVFCLPVFPEDPAVSIYRDYDDGLFGRSIYRGVIFSVKLQSFSRYTTLKTGAPDGQEGDEGLTAYLVSQDRAGDFAAGRGRGITILNPEERKYLFQDGGIRIVFSLEPAPEDFYDEIRKTYSGRFPEADSVIREVTASYRNGFLLRIHKAENVYRPEIARLDYEDILVSAALVGDSFQPLWGIHDGIDLGAPGE
jgi:hypothetical protein